MKIVRHTAAVEETIKKSRFIGVIVPCDSERQAHLVLNDLYQQHPNANHIAFAYRIQTDNGVICRFYDAGEPSGTAGKPIFQHLEGKQLINLVVAVIRYFGGIKLGAGGLSRAYSNSAKKVIEAADIVDFIEMQQLQLILEYSQMQAFEYHLHKLDGQIINQEFTDKVSVTIRLPAANMAQLETLINPQSN